MELTIKLIIKNKFRRKLKLLFYNYLPFNYIDCLLLIFLVSINNQIGIITLISLYFLKNLDDFHFKTLHLSILIFTLDVKRGTVAWE
jgi:hypothetical protein